MTSPIHQHPEERYPWLDPALASSRPIYYPRSEAEQAASAELMQEQKKDMQWNRRSAKVKFAIAVGLIAIILGFFLGAIYARIVV